MQLYIVVKICGDDQWEEFRTLNRNEAIEFARDAQARCKDKDFIFELRENEIADTLNYKTFDDYNSDDYNEKAANEFNCSYSIIEF